MPVTSSVVFQSQPSPLTETGTYVQFRDKDGARVVGIIYGLGTFSADIIVVASKSVFFALGEDYKMSIDDLEPFYGELKIEVT